MAIAIAVSSRCCTRAGRERVVPVLAYPVRAEGVVARHARAPLAEFRDDGTGYSKAPASPRWKTPRTTPSSGDEQLVGVVLEHQRDGVPDRRRRRHGRRRLDPGDVRLQLDVGERPQRQAAERAILADELRDELVGRVREDRVGRVVLREHAALAEDRDAVAHLDRLVDVVGDEDHRLADLPVQASELVLQPETRDRVERAERLVHQQYRRVGRERTRQADALALAAGQLRRIPLGVGRVEPDELEQLDGTLGDPPSCPSRAAAARSTMFSPIVM